MVTYINISVQESSGDQGWYSSNPEKNFFEEVGMGENNYAVSSRINSSDQGGTLYVGERGNSESADGRYIGYYRKVKGITGYPDFQMIFVNGKTSQKDIFAKRYAVDMMGISKIIKPHIACAKLKDEASRAEEWIFEDQSAVFDDKSIDRRIAAEIVEQLLNAIARNEKAKVFITDSKAQDAKDNKMKDKAYAAALQLLKFCIRCLPIRLANRLSFNTNIYHLCVKEFDLSCSETLGTDFSETDKAEVSVIDLRKAPNDDRLRQLQHKYARYVAQSHGNPCEGADKIEDVEKLDAFAATLIFRDCCTTLSQKIDQAERIKLEELNALKDAYENAAHDQNDADSKKDNDLLVKIALACLFDYDYYKIAEGNSELYSFLNDRLADFSDRVCVPDANWEKLYERLNGGKEEMGKKYLLFLYESQKRFAKKHPYLNEIKNALFAFGGQNFSENNEHLKQIYILFFQCLHEKNVLFEYIKQNEKALDHPVFLDALKAIYRDLEKQFEFIKKLEDLKDKAIKKDIPRKVLLSIAKIPEDSAIKAGACKVSTLKAIHEYFNHKDVDAFLATVLKRIFESCDAQTIGSVASLEELNDIVNALHYKPTEKEREIIAELEKAKNERNFKALSEQLRNGASRFKESFPIRTRWILPIIRRNNSYSASAQWTTECLNERHHGETGTRASTENYAHLYGWSLLIFFLAAAFETCLWLLFTPWMIENHSVAFWGGVSLNDYFLIINIVFMCLGIFVAAWKSIRNCMVKRKYIKPRILREIIFDHVSWYAVVLLTQINVAFLPYLFL